MFENGRNDFMEENEDFIFSLISDFAKCNAIIDVIKQEKLETDRLNEANYRFSNMAYIIQKVFDDDSNAIHGFADYINECIDDVLNISDELYE